MNCDVASSLGGQVRCGQVEVSGAEVVNLWE